MAAAQRKQSWGSGQDATGGSETSYSAWTPTAACRDGLGFNACRNEGGAARRALSAPPRCQPSQAACEALGAPRLPPRPAQPGPAEASECARARRRPGSPSECPRPACAVGAGGLRLFEQEGGHISPSRPPSPHPPSTRRATRPFASPGHSSSQKLPQPQPPGPDSRLPHRPLSSPSSPKSPSGTDLALPRRTPQQQPRSWPRRIGASGRAKWIRGCRARPSPAPQRGAGPARGPSGGGGGGSGSGSWHSSAPALHFRLSSSPSPAAQRSLHPAFLSLPPPAHLGTGSPPWRRRPGPARLKHFAGATRLVATALSAVVRGCRVGCDFGRPSGCGSPSPPARGLESGDPLSEGEEGEPGAPGDPGVPAPPPRGREPTAGGSWLKLLSATGAGTRVLSQ
ncbi:PREDICTED: skin secretory protein xP2-like [Lipotes vexillifer]|uniref:Skin secretory protein xP2-like n=1 Tax=Lipotes vexillifer TaxID=118797 RepID=A0A340WM22_LIPVE|nr:PREDICTED: skin secretory protein xP2-like [Lipotes vexillifer]